MNLGYGRIGRTRVPEGSDAIPVYVECPFQVSPRDYDPKGYYRFLRLNNLAFQRDVAIRLGKMEDIPNGAIVTTGSDARLEKGPYKTSKIEVFLIPDQKKDYEQWEEVAKRIGSMDEVERAEIWSEGDPIHTSYKGFTAFPNRIYETTTLYGNSENHKRAVEYLLRKLLTEEGGSIKRWLNGKFRAHRKATIQGYNLIQGEEKRHFTTQDGVILSFYDPIKKIESFKIGQLRLVQYGLLDQMASLLRVVEKDRVEETLEDLVKAPRNVVKRLKFFQKKGYTIDQREVMELIEAYEYFTWAYNIAQEEFQEKGLIVQKFDREEFITHQEAILGIFSAERKNKVLEF